MNKAHKFNDDHGPVHDRFQNFLYEQYDLANIQMKDWGNSTFRRRMEKAGARFILPHASPWPSKKPDDWVFDSPFGGHLVMDREAAEKMLVLGLP